MHPPDELSEPAHHAGIRRPLLEAKTRLARCHTADAVHRREMERNDPEQIATACSERRDISAPEDDALSDQQQGLPSARAVRGRLCCLQPPLHALHSRVPDRLP